MQTTDQAPPAYQPTDVRVDTVRADIWQDISYPFTLGSFRIVPYLVGDATYYS